VFVVLEVGTRPILHGNVTLGPIEVHDSQSEQCEAGVDVRDSPRSARVIRQRLRNPDDGVRKDERPVLVKEPAVAAPA
jgi:hypothetical protein